MVKNNNAASWPIVVVLVVIILALVVCYFGWLLMLLVGMLHATFAWPTVTIGFVKGIQFALVLLGLGVLGKASASTTVRK